MLSTTRATVPRKTVGNPPKPFFLEIGVPFFFGIVGAIIFCCFLGYFSSSFSG